MSIDDTDRDRWARAFQIFVTVGIIVSAVLGVREVIDKPIIRLGDVRSTHKVGQPVRAQVLARNSSSKQTYCVEITFEAVDRDGLTLERQVAKATTGKSTLRPGQSVNFAANFKDITDKEIKEKLDDFLAFVTERQEC